MTTQSNPGSLLRQQAEIRLAAQQVLEISTLSFDRSLLHELQVQKIELEMQSEVLADALVEAQALRVKYHDLYELAPVGYLTLDSGGDIVELNQRAVAMLGKNRSSVLSRPLLQHVAPDAASDAEHFLRAALEKQEEVGMDQLHLKRKTVTPFYVNAKARSFIDPASGERMIHVVLLDVSVLKIALDDVARSITTGSLPLAGAGKHEAS